MSRLIDADAFSIEMKKRQDECSEWVKKAKGNYRYRALGAWSILSEVKLTLDKMPTIDAVEVVHGEWIDRSGGIEGAWNYCSVCGEQAIDLYDFCPNCGAKMDGNEQRE